MKRWFILFLLILRSQLPIGNVELKEKQFWKSDRVVGGGVYCVCHPFKYWHIKHSKLDPIHISAFYLDFDIKSR